MARGFLSSKKCLGGKDKPWKRDLKLEGKGDQVKGKEQKLGDDWNTKKWQK